jgi:DnaJ-class molecular chaperone
MAKTPTLYCDDGSEIELPTKWVICSACAGEGKSSAYLGAYTRDDMDEAGPEFMDDYMAGHYDRACDSCDGAGKVQVADRTRISKLNWREWEAQCRDDREIRGIERAERRMGC